ncbi:4,5-DOPA dioxygenase extradiol [Silvanigrella paludirubra]|uniref:4,5-DOPA dioxygenase extradiol n=1 Tax=Silvanigrella paludirubra TaxID=2499159 RepID=A0A6N6VW64_9BACT|nr:class III extradiol ring-cleavage dioxygenase [Silvanigrella paludirubra]KAB8040895.1 4,5-DOPA dioxygenase extradiol [Silvanigrella paludirubra]
MKNKSTLPCLFIAHGSPLNAILQNEYTETLQFIGNELKPLVKSILCISAHWRTEGVYISGAEKLSTIYDFSGFPEELYKINYNPNGNIELTNKIFSLLSKYNPKIDAKRGIDHGAWSILIHLFPHYDIPVVQLSLNLDFKLQQHYEISSLLKPLREEGVLIIGSGNIVHSFFAFSDEKNAESPDWAIEFDHTIKKALIEKNHETIIKYRRLFGKSAKLSVPTEEHYIPLLYIIGLQQEKDKIRFIYEKFQNSGMSMRSFILE